VVQELLVGRQPRDGSLEVGSGGQGVLPGGVQAPVAHELSHGDDVDSAPEQVGGEGRKPRGSGPPRRLLAG
jgi:hypothetical protein